MKNEKKEIVDLLSNIDKNKVDKKEIQVKNVMLELKKNLANYLNSLISSAISEDSLLLTVKEYLLEKVPNLTFDQLMSLYKTLDQKKTVTNNQLTTLLKPTQQTSSPLLDAFSEVKKEESDIYTQTFNDMNSEDIRKIDKLDKLMLFVEKLANKENKEESKNDSKN